MEIIVASNLEGRLRNTHLSKSDALVPLFEAVVNAIQSLEDTPATQDFEPTITIKIVRVPQGKIPEVEEKSGRPLQEKIIGFEIVDNGVGFTETNYASFSMLDSILKEAKGGKGIGRLTWLKAFDHVEITSVFESESKDGNHNLQKRTFKCDGKQWVHDEKTVPVENGEVRQTKIVLYGLKAFYGDCIPKTGNTIAEKILEHCLWYYLRDVPPPRIILHDGDQTIDFDNTFEIRRTTTTKSESINIGEVPFQLSHIKLTTGQKNAPVAGLCANGRLVREVSLIGKVPSLFGPLKSGDGEFTYVCYVSSPILDDNVTNERTGFVLPEKSEKQGVLGGITIEGIIDAVAVQAANYLNSELAIVKQESTRRVKDYVNKVAPRYRPLIDRFPEICEKINPNIKDADLDVQLHKELAAFENKVIQEGHKILEANEDEPFEGYSQRVDDYLQGVSAMKKSDLANYVTHRKVVLQFLRKCLKKKIDGSYFDEDSIHKLIMPMIATGDGLSLQDANLWIIDERLAFYDYIASDKPIRTMPGDQSGSRLEPDIVRFSSFDKAVMVSDGAARPTAITIIELKKPMRNDYTDGPRGNPIDQVLEYLGEIRNNRNICTADGRPLDGRKEIPAFCYIICDITSRLDKISANRSFNKTIDGLGYYTYNLPYNAYIEIIPYDKLLTAAEERNKAFFEKLGLPES